VTLLRKHRDAISNYFHEVELGIGKRNSSFTDIDGVSHDRDTERFLFREFKQENEPLDKAQREALQALARLENFTVWLLRKLADRQIGFGQFGSGKIEEAISEDEYRRRLKCWWRNVDPALPDVPRTRASPATPSRPTFERLLQDDPAPPW